MAYNDIVSILKDFNTVDGIVDVINHCKTNNVNVFKVVLKDGVSPSDFNNEFVQTVDDFDKYLILLYRDGRDDDNRFIVGVFNAVKDLFTYCYENYKFDPHMPISVLVDKCVDIINNSCGEYRLVWEDEWLNFKPELKDIDAIDYK